MILTTKTILLLAAIFLTGLSAGFFYAWQVSVIPGTQRITDSSYLESMQSINKAILNPAFFLVFFGCLISLGVATAFHYKQGATFWLLLAAFLTYLLGTFFVTAFGNVPLNDQLEAMNLANLDAMKSQSFRQSYEQRWNWLHLIRTGFSLVAFLLALLAAFQPLKS
jgi:uncharacterized membrane protein